MQVIVPKTSGFCPGVTRAENGVFKLKESIGYVNLHGPLIHNANYATMLEEHNIKTVNIDLLDPGETVVIRTHGISKREEAKLSQKFILKDLTCPIVKKVQKHVEKASLEKAFIVISGKKEHAEVQGLVSYADHFLVIETQDDLDYFILNYRKIIGVGVSQIFILSQTTHSREFFEHLCSTIQSKIVGYTVTIRDTICSVTEKKEQESVELQKNVDYTIVIGDSNSSNSKKLYQILKKENSNTLFTKNLAHLKELKDCWNGIKKVLVVSSTSTPLFIEQEIVFFLEQC